jgi:hypothetical protein
MVSSPESGQSWRKQPRRSAARQTGGSWQDRQQDRLIDPVFKNRIILALLAATALVLIAVLVAFVLLRPRSVHMLAIAVNNTQEAVPPNSFATEDLNRLERVLSGYKNVTLDWNAQPPGEKDAFLQTIRSFLESVKPGGPDKNLVMLYISAHGVTDERGDPCLLLGDSDPLRSTTWLPVGELFALLRSPPLDHLANANKLVFLDAGRMGRNWSMGQLYNGFADALPEAVELANVPNLVVINSTRPGQRSYVSPKLNGSVFGFYVADALRGAAAPDSRKFSLTELFSYLRDNVQGWSNANRPVPQEPMLISPDVQDFSVAYVADYSPVEPVPASLPSRALSALWNDHESMLQASKPHQLNPVVWARLGRLLVRLEQLSLAGQAYQSEFDRVSAEAGQLINRLKQSRVCEPFSGCNVLLAHDLAGAADQNSEALRQWNAWLEHQKKPEEEQKKEPLKLTLDHRSAADFVWSEVVTKQPTKSQLDQVVKFLQDVPSSEAVEYREIQLLKLLDQWLDWSVLGDEVSWALAARRASSHIAVPGDVRAHYWIRPWQDQADAELRVAEDCLFVGNAEALKLAQERWKTLLGQNQTGGEFGEILALSQLVTQAYALRDEAWAGLADWASWAVESFSLSADPKLADRVNELVKSCNHLSKLLEQAPADRPAPEQLDALREATESVSMIMSELKSDFGKQVDDLVNSGDIQAAFAQRDCIMTLPIVTGKRRQSLREQFLEQLDKNNSPGANAVRKSADDSEYLQWLANLDPHPALQLLGINPEQEGQVSSERAVNVKKLARQGGLIRQRLAELRGTIEPLVKATRQQLESASDSIVQARVPLAQADNILRPALAIAIDHGWPPESDDPCHLLQRLDHHAFLLWHGASCLNDFFGSGKGTTDTPYFAAAVQQHLDAAAKVWPDSAKHRELLANSLRAARQAFGTWNPLQAGDVQGSTTEAFVPHRINFVPGKDAIPNGVPAVFVSSSASLLPLHATIDESGPGTIRRRPAIVHQSKTFEHYFSKADIGDENFFKAVCFYRGHLFDQPFEGKETNAAIVNFQRNDNPQASIRVRGGERQTTQIVFVLDCSGSMSKGIANNQGSRMDGARRALKAIVGGLPIEESNFDVTLVAYAHRAQWPSRTATEPRASPFFNRNKRPGQPLPHPSDDVEIFAIQGLDRQSRFDDDARNQLFRIIDDLAPWGQTPLYYAVSQGLAQFRGIDGPKHLIVITDGDDDRWKPSSAVPPKNTIDTAAKALAANRGLGARVSFLLFRFEGSDAEIKAADARDPNLDIYKPDSEQALADSIEKSLRLVDYVVQSKDQGNAQSLAKKRINTVWRLSSVDPGTEFTVRLVNRENVRPMTVVLDGGEAIDLEFNSEKNRLEFPAFSADFVRPVRSNLQYATGASDERFVVAALLPHNSGSGSVTFRLSIQNQNPIQFTSRPKHVWAEVRPIYDENGSPGTPVFYVMDPQFEDNRPVPVLRLNVAGWPDNAEWADIRLWFSMHSAELKPPISISLDAREHSPIRIKNAELTTDLRVNRDDGSAELTLTEQHEELDGYPLWMHVFPEPSKVTRAFVEEQRRVRHTYSFARSDLRGIDKIQVWTAQPDDVTKNWIEVTGLPHVPITNLGR